MAPIDHIRGPDMAPQAPHAAAERSPHGGGAESGAGPDAALHTRSTLAERLSRGDESSPVLAIVKDLFFVARIRETARLAGVALTFARSPEEIAYGVGGARFVLLDLTGAFDHDRILGAAEAAGTPVLGFTTHALARQTQGWHGRCARVVTKETLTAELPTLLREGVGR